VPAVADAELHVTPDEVLDRQLRALALARELAR
jgi:hypothetical protein